MNPPSNPILTAHVQAIAVLLLQIPYRMGVGRIVMKSPDIALSYSIIIRKRCRQMQEGFNSAAIGESCMSDMA